MRLPAALLCLALVVSLSTTSYAAPVGQRVCGLADPRISESSGVAVSTRGDVLWTHNDSGDSARWFGVDARTCRTVSSYRLDLPAVTVAGEGVPTSFDWEDMARGVAADGTPVLLFADIGDNSQFRAGSVVVYEVAEPAGHTDHPAVEAPVPVRAVYQLVYPHAPVDAESIAMTPSGRLVVVTKQRSASGDYTGKSQVFMTSSRPATGPNVLTRVSDLDVTRLPGASAKDLDSLAVTSADVSRDGRWLLVRTYTTAYLFPLRFPLGRPRAIPLLTTRQGEAIAFAADGRGFWTTSEGAHAPVDRYRL